MSKTKLALIAVALVCAAVMAMKVGREDHKPSPSIEVTSFPETIDKTCNFGRAKLYDQCGSQVDLFQSAAARAKEEGKTVLVSYGAEWCIWCHVFSEHIKGHHSQMDYRYADQGETTYAKVTLSEKGDDDIIEEAVALNQYVADNFVILHIDSQMADDGSDALIQMNAMEHVGWSIPFIFTVDTQGRYSGHIISSDVQIRRDTFNWYRGYDRAILLEKLTELRDASRS